jgi:response regulator RpfG family c-di-GMP phosphodiesterase
LLDLGLPVMDGDQVVIRIRQEALSPKLVIIAMTGHGQDECRQRSRAAGIDHHLVEPVHPDALLPLSSHAEPVSGFEVCSTGRCESSAAVASGGVLARRSPLGECKS